MWHVERYGRSQLLGSHGCKPITYSFNIIELDRDPGTSFRNAMSVCQDDSSMSTASIARCPRIPNFDHRKTSVSPKAQVAKKSTDSRHISTNVSGFVVYRLFRPGMPRYCHAADGIHESEWLQYKYTYSFEPLALKLIVHTTFITNNMSTDSCTQVSALCPVEATIYG